ncbi:unnamed protein product [Pieris brassicae]|uniref:Uncharacterized protein n=1 Tax=Pieris brassicae TaxID=7116 RepID=A0A9P0XF23_PIEBR|nr:unnamed protein product [Pieris brassicae]
MCKYLPEMTDYALVNIAELQLLKFPLDYRHFKLVILVPTEKSTVCGLFQRLVENGVSSALQSIQPLFTVISDLKSPNINFYEENEFTLEVYIPKATANPILNHVLILQKQNDFYSQLCITTLQYLLDSI